MNPSMVQEQRIGQRSPLPEKALADAVLPSLESSGIVAQRPILPYKGPAICTSGILVDTVHRAARNAYEWLKGPGYFWGAQLVGDRDGLVFHQITFGQSVIGMKRGEPGSQGRLDVRAYAVRLNFFDPTVNRSLVTEELPHNHFRPLGVLPIALDGASTDEAYQMPWLRKKAGVVVERGCMSVRCGQAYGIQDHLDVYHSVYTTTPHISVVIGQYKPDVQYPEREPAPVKSLDNIESGRLRQMFQGVLERYLAQKSQ